MAMSKNKTTETDNPVEHFINAVDDDKKRQDCEEILAIMKKVTRREPKMWGSSMVGFGNYHYKYASGKEGDFFITGFSPRKAALTIYIMPGFSGYADLMEQLGPHKTGKSCLYVKNLDVINRDVLQQLITQSVVDMRKKYKCS